MTAVNSRSSYTISTLVLLAFAAVAGTFSLRAYDLFWHLATGRWILEHRALPKTDPFRFTSDGVPWVDHEWLFQVVARGMELIGGLDGLVLFRAAIVVLIAVVLLFSMRHNGTPQASAVIITAGALLLARPRFMLRPELFSLLAQIPCYHLTPGSIEATVDLLAATFQESARR